MITKLVAFDFDRTLFATPDDITGKTIWEKKTGKKYLR